MVVAWFIFVVVVKPIVEYVLVDTGLTAELVVVEILVVEVVFVVDDGPYIVVVVNRKVVVVGPTVVLVTIGPVVVEVVVGIVEVVVVVVEVVDPGVGSSLKVPVR